ncbi:hypothetical protein MAR_009779 [Mya arenaria]|uniref:Uncharacterized protein n=1 Tax=Mya arenaria TaxID=6604 RepID=A0ABY7E7V2_MYAAR|nr:hypothetical protein MAR_009779 [Mya arenaria]
MDIIRNFEAAATLMSSDPNSQLALVSKRQHIKLSPKYLGNIRTGISCHMTCALARYTNDVKPDEPDIEVKKTRKKKKNKKEQPDCVSVDNETGLGEETILAGAGTNIEIGLDSSGLEPVFSSTQVEGGEVTQPGKKAKKHKKKNRETDDSVNELTTSSGFNSVLDGASTSDSFMKKSESDCNEVIHKKKKKKHSRSELSFENGLSHEESVNVSDMNDGVFQASYSANKKNRKRKHSESVQNNGRCEANKTSSLEDSAEVLYPKKKHKKNKKTDPDRDPSSNLTSIENQDETQEQSMHSKNKKKHKKGQK